CLMSAGVYLSYSSLSSSSFTQLCPKAMRSGDGHLRATYFVPLIRWMSELGCGDVKSCYIIMVLPLAVWVSVVFTFLRYVRPVNFSKNGSSVAFASAVSALIKSLGDTAARKYFLSTWLI